MTLPSLSLSLMLCMSQPDTQFEVVRLIINSRRPSLTIIGGPKNYTHTHKHKRHNWKVQKSINTYIYILMQKRPRSNSNHSLFSNQNLSFPIRVSHILFKSNSNIPNLTLFKTRIFQFKALAFRIQISYNSNYLSQSYIINISYKSH